MSAITTALQEILRDHGPLPQDALLEMLLKAAKEELKSSDAFKSTCKRLPGGTQKRLWTLKEPATTQTTTTEAPTEGFCKYTSGGICPEAKASREACLKCPYHKTTCKAFNRSLVLEPLVLVD